MKQVTCDSCGHETGAEVLEHAVVYVIGGRISFPRLEMCHDCADALCEIIRNFADAPTAPKSSWEAEREVWREQRDAFRATAGEQRQRLILETLGTDRLTIAEICERLSKTHGDRFGRVHESMIRGEIYKMLRADLDRARDDYRGKTRFRYFRRPGLSGPIAALDALLGHEAEDR
jgi:hypothetical protein